MTAETITPNQLTLQALTSDEEECIVDDLTKDPTCEGSISRGADEVYIKAADDASLSSDNESGNSIPIETVESHAGKMFWSQQTAIYIKTWFLFFNVGF